MAVDFSAFCEPKTDGGNSNIGPNIDTTTIVNNVLVPTAKYHVLLANGLIKNITPPYAGFSGTIGLIAGLGSAFTWDATGNIALASAAAPSVGKIVFMTYIPTTGKWYPHSSVAA